MLTQQRLKELLHYDPETGIFTWINSMRGGWNGRQAGSENSDGYLQIVIDGLNQKLHRIAFLYVDGVMPPGIVDHADGDRTNNSYRNLRHADRASNNHNAKMPITNVSGIKGVHFSPPHGKWKAEINYRKKRFYLGLFEDIKEAESVVRAKREELHGEFARHE